MVIQQENHSGSAGFGANADPSFAIENIAPQQGILSHATRYLLGITDETLGFDLFAAVQHERLMAIAAPRP